MMINNVLYRVSLFVVLLHIPCCFTAFAQEIVVDRVELSLKDASASTTPREDENGISCALLKIATVNKNVEFFGNVVGEVVNKTNEYWVYMKNGSECITLSAPYYSPITISFPNYEIESLQSKTTYNITITFKRPITEEKKSKSQLSFEDCRIAAKSGSPSALVDLGKCYLYGLGTNENPSEAARLFDKAAKSGYIEAIHLLGDSYFYGLGNPKNYEIAVEYYTKAADNDYAPSLYSLGICYEQGKGVKLNEKKAQKYFIQAANKGYAKAKNKIRRN